MESEVSELLGQPLLLRQIPIWVATVNCSLKLIGYAYVYRVPKVP